VKEKYLGSNFVLQKKDFQRLAEEKRRKEEEEDKNA
jgi:lipopolysaccharide export system ATP-binding protein